MMTAGWTRATTSGWTAVENTEEEVTRAEAGRLLGMSVSTLKRMETRKMLTPRRGTAATAPVLYLRSEVLALRAKMALRRRADDAGGLIEDVKGVAV
jgi:hypothetical protein